MFVVATVVIVVALHAEAIVPFLVVSAIAGTAQGASNSGSMRAVFAHVLPEDRAGTLATLYLISYAVLPFQDWRREANFPHAGLAGCWDVLRGARGRSGDPRPRHQPRSCSKGSAGIR